MSKHGDVSVPVYHPMEDTDWEEDLNRLNEGQFEKAHGMVRFYSALRYPDSEDVLKYKLKKAKK